MTACALCLVGDPELAAEGCLGERKHSTEAVELARIMARAVHGEAADDVKASWFADDAAYVIDYLGVQPTWSVSVPSGDVDFLVNGVSFTMDPNADGYAPPEPLPPAGCPRADCEDDVRQDFMSMEERDGVRVVMVECSACGHYYERAPWFPEAAQ